MTEIVCNVKECRHYLKTKYYGICKLDKVRIAREGISIKPICWDYSDKKTITRVIG